MSFLHSFMAVTTDFDLEEVLADYLNTHPEGEVESFDVAFRTMDEHRRGHISYIVVFTLKKSAAHVPRFTEYLTTYCKGHGVVAFAGPINHILPKIDGYGRGYHVFGNPEKYLDTAAGENFGTARSEN